MPEVTTTPVEPEAPEDIVFDAGWGNTFSLSGLHFTNGLLRTSRQAEKDIVRNFITQTGEPWTEAPYNPANPRHATLAKLADNAHIITGTQTSDSYLGVTGQNNQLANSIIDGTFTKLASDPASGIDPATLVAAQDAVLKSNAPIVPGPAAGKAK